MFAAGRLALSGPDQVSLVGVASPAPTTARASSNREGDRISIAITIVALEATDTVPFGSGGARLVSLSPAPGGGRVRVSDLDVPPGVGPLSVRYAAEIPGRPKPERSSVEVYNWTTATWRTMLRTGEATPTFPADYADYAARPSRDHKQPRPPPDHQRPRSRPAAADQRQRSPCQAIWLSVAIDSSGCRISSSAKRLSRPSPKGVDLGAGARAPLHPPPHANRHTCTRQPTPSALSFNQSVVARCPQPHRQNGGPLPGSAHGRQPGSRTRRRAWTPN